MYHIGHLRVAYMCCENKQARNIPSISTRIGYGTLCFLPIMPSYQYWFRLHRLRLISHTLVSPKILFWMWLLHFFLTLYFFSLFFHYSFHANFCIDNVYRVIYIRIIFRCSFMYTGGSRNRNLNILWVAMRMCFRKETPPALPILEHQVAPGHAAPLPTKVSLTSEAIHCREVKNEESV